MIFFKKRKEKVMQKPTVQVKQTRTKPRMTESLKHGGTNQNSDKKQPT